MCRSLKAINLDVRKVLQTKQTLVKILSKKAEFKLEKKPFK